MTSGVAFVQRGGLRGGLAGAAGLGIGGALVGASGEDKTLKERVLGGLAGGALGAGAGLAAGRRIGSNINKTRWLQEHPSAPAKPDWLKGISDHDVAHKAYKRQARIHHPDIGGSQDAFVRLGAEWDDAKAMMKKAMLDGFADELEKIAGLGALLGGAAGYKLSPNTLKGKLIGTLGGAAVGSMLGSAAKAGKRMFHDELKQREHASLYGYVPAGTQEAQGSNFY